MLLMINVREHPIICTDIQIRTTFGSGGWVSFRKPGAQISCEEKDIIVYIFFGHECLDLGVGG